MSLRVILHAIGSAGDVHPFLGIGSALKARGHGVFVVISPAFESAVLAAGLEFRALGTLVQFHQTKDDPDLWHPRGAFPAVIRHAVDPSHGPILEITRDLQRAGGTVMVASSLAIGPRTASELLGIPYATVHLSPAIFPSVFRQPEIHGLPFGNRAPKFLKRLQWKLAGKVVDHFALPELNRFRSRHGLPPATNLFNWWNSPQRVIALFPAWFAPMQPDWPAQTRQTGFPLFAASATSGWAWESLPGTSATSRLLRPCSACSHPRNTGAGRARWPGNLKPDPGWRRPVPTSRRSFLA